MPPGLVLIGTDLWIPWGGDPLTMPTQRPPVQRARAPRAGRVAGAGERRARRRSPARRAGPRRRSFPSTRTGSSTATPWAAALLQGRAAGRVHAAWRRRARAPHRLRQSHQSLPRALDDAAARAGRAARARRGAMARWCGSLLTESVLLSLAGAAVGLAIAWFGLKGAGALIPGQLPDARPARRASTCACSGGAWRLRSPAGCWSACCRRSRRRAPIRTIR